MQQPVGEQWSEHERNSLFRFYPWFVTAVSWEAAQNKEGEFIRGVLGVPDPTWPCSKAGSLKRTKENHHFRENPFTCWGIRVQKAESCFAKAGHSLRG